MAHFLYFNTNTHKMYPRKTSYADALKKPAKIQTDVPIVTSAPLLKLTEGDDSMWTLNRYILCDGEWTLFDLQNLVDKTNMRAKRVPFSFRFTFDKKKLAKVVGYKKLYDVISKFRKCAPWDFVYSHGGSSNTLEETKFILDVSDKIHFEDNASYLDKIDFGKKVIYLEKKYSHWDDDWTDVYVYCVSCDLVYKYSSKKEGCYDGNLKIYGHCCTCHGTWKIRDKGYSSDGGDRIHRNDDAFPETCSKCETKKS